jgi:hypothetical protein
MNIWLSIRAVARKLRDELIECNDTIDFLHTALASQERKKAQLEQRLARLGSPADMRRSCREPI